MNAKIKLFLSMFIFGTIGLFVRNIPLPSSVIALVRAFVGTLFLVVLLLAKRERPDFAAIRRNLRILALSGTAMGFNWILLFEAYRYTSVATATLCYYLAPILVILAAPLVLKEKLTQRKGICAAVALAGMVLVSGVLDADFSGSGELIGIGFGLAAAVLYASVILTNKKIADIGAYDKTIGQLGVAALVLLPYVLLTEDISQLTFDPLSLLLLLIAGIIHTGIAYWLYFGSMEALPAQTVALYSYIDPILAIVLSMVVLREPMTVLSGIGAVMILGAAYISER